MKNENMVPLISLLLVLMFIISGCVAPETVEVSEPVEVPEVDENITEIDYTNYFVEPLFYDSILKHPEWVEEIDWLLIAKNIYVEIPKENYVTTMYYEDEILKSMELISGVEDLNETYKKLAIYKHDNMVTNADIFDLGTKHLMPLMGFSSNFTGEYILVEKKPLSMYKRALTKTPDLFDGLKVYKDPFFFARHNTKTIAPTEIEGIKLRLNLKGTDFLSIKNKLKKTDVDKLLLLYPKKYKQYEEIMSTKCEFIKTCPAIMAVKCTFDGNVTRSDNAELYYWKTIGSLIDRNSIPDFETINDGGVSLAKFNDFYCNENLEKYNEITRYEKIECKNRKSNESKKKYCTRLCVEATKNSKRLCNKVCSDSKISSTIEKIKHFRRLFCTTLDDFTMETKD